LKGFSNSELKDVLEHQLEKEYEADQGIIGKGHFLSPNIGKDIQQYF
jgi:hypothetical protein